MIWFSNPIGWFCGSSKIWLISYSTLINLIRSQSNLIFKDPNRWLASQTSDWSTLISVYSDEPSHCSPVSLTRIWHCSRCAHTLRRADTAAWSNNHSCLSQISSWPRGARWQCKRELSTAAWSNNHSCSSQISSWPRGARWQCKRELRLSEHVDSVLPWLTEWWNVDYTHLTLLSLRSHATSCWHCSCGARWQRQRELRLSEHSLTTSERTETVRTRNVDSALLHLLTLFSRLTYRYALRDKSTQGSAMARGQWSRVDCWQRRRELRLTEWWNVDCSYTLTLLHLSSNGTWYFFCFNDCHLLIYCR